ncbi:MAG: hypothetical protein LBI30_00960 [Holosporales bacterium]|nr:hypothetical protein [Holosporales bacterium]
MLFVLSICFVYSCSYVAASAPAKPASRARDLEDKVAGALPPRVKFPEYFNAETAYENLEAHAANQAHLKCSGESFADLQARGSKLHKKTQSGYDASSFSEAGPVEKVTYDGPAAGDSGWRFTVTHSPMEVYDVHEDGTAAVRRSSTSILIVKHAPRNPNEVGHYGTKHPK